MTSFIKKTVFLFLFQILNVYLSAFIFEDIMKKNHKVYFENKDLPCTGVPFIILSSSTLDCRQGKDKNLKAKA